MADNKTQAHHPETPPKLRETLEAYAYLSPAAIILAIFWAFPVLLSFVISFRNFKALDTWDSTRWVGFDQYKRALIDEAFWQAFWNTVNYVIYSVPPTLALALGAAMLLNTKIKARGFFRASIFLPYITTWVAISIVWKYFFHRDIGLANLFLSFISHDILGLSQPWRLTWLSEPRGIWDMLLGTLFEAVGILKPGAGTRFSLGHPILSGPSLSMFSIIITSVWRDVGYFMIIFLAGLQNIDKTYYEAAEIDGANGWQRFRTITVPLLSPVTFFLLVISMIGAFKIFTPMLIMTPNGGPDNTTSSLVFYLYEKGFRSWLFGYASAIAYLLFIIILVLTVIQNKVFGKRVEYGN